MVGAPQAEGDVPITNTKDALKRVRIRLRRGNKLKPPVGTWKQMTENDIMPRDRLYLITHVGGWGGLPDINDVRLDTNITVSTRVTNYFLYNISKCKFAICVDSKCGWIKFDHCGEASIYK